MSAEAPLGADSLAASVGESLPPSSHRAPASSVTTTTAITAGLASLLPGRKVGRWQRIVECGARGRRALPPETAAGVASKKAMGAVSTTELGLTSRGERQGRGRCQVEGVRRQRGRSCGSKRALGRGSGSRRRRPGRSRGSGTVMGAKGSTGAAASGVEGHAPAERRAHPSWRVRASPRSRKRAPLDRPVPGCPLRAALCRGAKRRFRGRSSVGLSRETNIAATH